MTLKQSYELLGISENSGIVQVKSAFRKRSKDLHPDHNSSSSANEEFIELVEAYLKILQHMERRKQDSGLMNREKAECYGELSFEELTKTDLYSNTHSVVVILEHFYLFTSLLFLISPILGFILAKTKGLLVGFVIIFVSSPYWSGLFTEKFKWQFGALRYSFRQLLKNSNVVHGLYAIGNTIVFLSITLNTQVKTITFLWIFLIVAAISLLLNQLLFKHVKKAIFNSVFRIAPSIINMFFVINYCFSSNQQVETYAFKQHQEWHTTNIHRYDSPKGKFVNTTLIELENEKYNDYLQNRFFIDYGAIENKHQIRYTFETGLFGLMVLKSYSFQ